MTKFTHRMKTATFNALADKHLWLSLFNRPAQSRFTRTQRVTCCATILYVFVGVNAMWYGLLKKSNTEIGFGDFGWEEIVLALVSNVMVLPISIGLVYLFKKSRPKVKVTILDHSLQFSMYTFMIIFLKLIVVGCLNIRLYDKTDTLG